MSAATAKKHRRSLMKAATIYYNYRRRGPRKRWKGIGKKGIVCSLPRRHLLARRRAKRMSAAWEATLFMARLNACRGGFITYLSRWKLFRCHNKSPSLVSEPFPMSNNLNKFSNILTLKISCWQSVNVLAWRSPRSSSAITHHVTGLHFSLKVFFPYGLARAFRISTSNCKRF